MVTTRSGTQITADPPEESKPVEKKRNLPTTPRPSKRPRTSLKSKKEYEEAELTGSKFDEIPVETFTQVCSYLHPADLVSLARTCKTFRATLMNSSAEHIWHLAETSVPKLPTYPWSNMCPPQYAALLFTRNCTVCGENTTSSADPYLLVRLCSVCRETELVEVAGRDFRWKDPMKLVCKTTMMHFRKKDAKKRPRGSGLLKYCLKKELEQLETTFKVLSPPGCAEALARWKKEVQDEGRLRREFGDKLNAFSNNNDAIRSRELAKIRRERTLAIEERLLDLGWTEDDLTFRWPNHQKWTALVEQPRPLTDRVWSNLFPKLIPLLELNRVEHEEEDKRARKESRQLQIHKRLRQFKLDAHPLAPVVRHLGFEPALREPKDGPTPAVVRNVLECYPFPASNTALDQWPCFAKVGVDEMTTQEVQTWFEAHLEQVRECTDNYKMIVETDLVLRLFTVWDQWDHDFDKEKYRVKVDGNEECTQNLTDLTRLLLRADVVFSRSAPENPSGQGQVLYYPEFISPNSTFSRYTYSWNQPSKFSAKGYHPHLAGESIAKELLECLKMPDASYLELALAGERFMCGRCYMQKPLSWKGMIQHYLDEIATLDRMIATGPRFKTRHQVPLVEPHDLDANSYNTPFVELLTPEAAEQMRANPQGTPSAQGAEYCIPCKNYGRMFVSSIAEQMGYHLQNMHSVARLTKDVHFGLISDSGTFLEIGGIWKENWDAHYGGLESGAGQTGGDEQPHEGFHDVPGAVVAQSNGSPIVPVPVPLDTTTASTSTSIVQVISHPGGVVYESDSEEEFSDWGEGSFMDGDDENAGGFPGEGEAEFLAGQFDDDE